MPIARQLSVIFRLGAASMLLLGCAQTDGQPDTAEAQQQIFDSRTELRKIVDETVNDIDRAATVQSLLDKRDQLVKEQMATVAKYQADLQAMNADYDSSRQKFEQLMTAYNEDRLRIQSAFIAYIGDMKASTTKEEWKVLANFESKKLDPWTIMPIGVET
jgi:hypothetical protein